MTKTKDFTKEDAIQAAEHLIDTYPMLGTAQELFDAGRLEGLFDGHQQAMATWGRLMSRINPENCGKIPAEDAAYFAKYFIELKCSDVTNWYFEAGLHGCGNIPRKNVQSFKTYEEAQSHLDSLESAQN